MDIVPIYMSFVSKLVGHFGQKSGLIGHWPADMDLYGIPPTEVGKKRYRYLVLVPM